MRNKIESLTKHIFLNCDLDVKSVNDDFFLFDQIKIDSVLNHPFRLDVMTCIICQQGECSGKVDLMPLHVQAPSITIMLSNTLLEYHHVRDDFNALVLSMSPRSLQSFNI